MRSASTTAYPRFEAPSQRLAAARQQNGTPEADCIRRKARGVFCCYRNALVSRDARMNLCQPLCREGGWIIHHGTTRQRTETGVEVVKGWVGKRESDARTPNCAITPRAPPLLSGSHNPSRTAAGARPRGSRRRLQRYSRGQRKPRRSNRASAGHETPRHKPVPRPAAAGSESARAVPCHRTPSGNGGEDEIGQVTERLDQIDAGATGTERVEQAVPLPLGGGVQRVAAFLPSGRIIQGMMCR